MTDLPAIVRRIGRGLRALLAGTDSDSRYRTDRGGRPARGVRRPTGHDH